MSLFYQLFIQLLCWKYSISFIPNHSISPKQQQLSNLFKPKWTQCSQSTDSDCTTCYCCPIIAPLICYSPFLYKLIKIIEFSWWIFVNNNANRKVKITNKLMQQLFIYLFKYLFFWKWANIPLFLFAVIYD